jgi:hypothetical protein
MWFLNSLCMMDSLDNCQQRAQAAKTFIESRMQEFQVLLEYHHRPFLT